MNKLKHPLVNVVQYLRILISITDKNIGEGIFWNAATFYFTGKMAPFIPNEYKRYIVGFVFNRQDCIRLVFLRGASVSVNSELLEGEYKDGRRLASVTSIDDVKSK